MAMTYEEYCALEVEEKECRGCGRIMSKAEVEDGGVCGECREETGPRDD